MTRIQARDAIRRHARAGALIVRRHFDDRLTERRCTMQDVYRVINTGVVAEGPIWEDRHQNFNVTMEGRTTDGDVLRLVLGVTEQASCLVTVIPL